MGAHDPETLDRKHREAKSGAVAGAARRARAAAPVRDGQKAESEWARDAEHARWDAEQMRQCRDALCGHPRCDRMRAAALRKAAPAVKTPARVCGYPLPGVDEYEEPRKCRVVGPCRWHPETRT